MIHLGSNAMASHKSVYGEGKVECGAACRHGAYLTFRREDEYLRSEEIQFDGVKKVHCIRLRVIKYFLDGSEPLVKLKFRRGLCLIAIFIFPMSGKTFLCYLVHAA